MFLTCIKKNQFAREIRDVHTQSCLYHVAPSYPEYENLDPPHHGRSDYKPTFLPGEQQVLGGGCVYTAQVLHADGISSSGPKLSL